MGSFDHCKTKGEVQAAYKARCDAINENYRNNIRKIDEESAKVQRECDEEIARLKPWLYIIGTILIAMLFKIFFLNH